GCGGRRSAGRAEAGRTEVPGAVGGPGSEGVAAGAWTGCHCARRASGAAAADGLRPTGDGPASRPLRTLCHPRERLRLLPCDAHREVTPCTAPRQRWARVPHSSVLPFHTFGVAPRPAGR